MRRHRGSRHRSEAPEEPDDRRRTFIRMRRGAVRAQPYAGLAAVPGFRFLPRQIVRKPVEERDSNGQAQVETFAGQPAERRRRERLDRVLFESRREDEDPPDAEHGVLLEPADGGANTGTPDGARRRAEEDRIRIRPMDIRATGRSGDAVDAGRVLLAAHPGQNVLGDPRKLGELGGARDEGAESVHMPGREILPPAGLGGPLAAGYHCTLVCFNKSLLGWISLSPRRSALSPRSRLKCTTVYGGVQSGGGLIK